MLTTNGSRSFETVPSSEPQTNSTALLALARVAAHHGLSLDVNQISRSHPFTTEEPAAELLLQIIARAGLKGKRMHVKRGDLASVSRLVPFIMLYPEGKAAVVRSIQQTAGPSVAVVEQFDVGCEVSALYDEPRLFESWSGDFIAVRMPFLAAGSDPPFGFAWMAKQMWIERALFRDISIAAVLMTGLSLVPPLTGMVMIDRVLVNHSESTLEILTIVIVAAIFFETLFGFLRRQLSWLTTSRIDARLNIFIFDRLLNLPMSFFERQSTGRINGKLAQVWRIRDFLTNQLFGTLLDSVTLAILIPVLFILNWRLSFLIVALAVLMFVISIVFLPGLRARYGAMIEAEHAMASHQVESIYGIKTIKSLCLEGLRRYQRDIRVARVVKTHQEFELFANIPRTLVHPLDRFMYGGSLILGCYMALSAKNESSIGSVVAFAMLAGRISSPIVQIANLLNVFEEARGAMSEVASVVNVPAEEGRSGSGLKLPITGRVIFQDVRFRYSPSAPYALNGVSFDIPQGSIFGIMGRSGSGKTTVTRLLQGLNRDYEGMVKVDGMDLREIDLDHLRSNIGVVPQENFLFSGTIRDNISAARPKASFDQIVRAAQLAGAEEFIERMPRGYDTVVEEGAVNFSGGQRQRLAIARALLVNPAILVLDEATSALDAESEAIVNANLMRIAQGRTVIIISHRLASLVMADAILVLEQGKFYDCGPHSDLVKNCDIYRMLWKQQNRHLEREAEDVDAHLQSAQTL
jgi:ATP-binding cassette, subfamily B, bacterial HlyB/CyaB